MLLNQTVFKKASGVDYPNISLSYSSFISSHVRGTKAFGLLPLPFFLRSFCFDFKSVRAFQTPPKSPIVL